MRKIKYIARVLIVFIIFFINSFCTFSSPGYVRAITVKEMGKGTFTEEFKRGLHALYDAQRNTELVVFFSSFALVIFALIPASVRKKDKEMG